MSYNVFKGAALREATTLYRERASAGGGTFHLGGFEWRGPRVGYDILTERYGRRIPVDISQIVERQTGDKALAFNGDVDHDAALVVAAVDQHLVDGK
jgi:hypothetical protein